MAKFSKDYSKIYAEYSNQLYILDALSGTVLDTIGTIPDYTYDLDVDIADSNNIIGAATQQYLCAYDVKNKKMLFNYPGLYRLMSVSPDGKYLATSKTGESSITIWDVFNDKKLTSIPVSDDQYLWKLKFSPDGKYLVYSTNIYPENDLTGIISTSSWAKEKILENKTAGYVEELSFSNDGRYFIPINSLGIDNTTNEIYDVTANFTSLRKITYNDIKIYPYSSAFSNNNSGIFFGGDDNEYVYVKYYDLNKSIIIDSLILHTGYGGDPIIKTDNNNRILINYYDTLRMYSPRFLSVSQTEESNELIFSESSNGINISSNTDNVTQLVSITDVKGNEYSIGKTIYPKSSYYFNTGDFTTGVYFIKYSINNNTKIHKIIISR